MSDLQLTGFIEKIFDLETFDSGFQKKNILLTTKTDYPSTYLIEFLKDRSDLPDAYKEGEDVTVHINLQSRKWTSPAGEDKYFTSITGWKIAREGTGETKTKESVATEMVTGKKATATPAQAFDIEDSDSELPF